ncbi:conserved hypothetical protein [Candidatus Sulfopaludibacter sp. SbA3]|nr:conserved hypothetical protein [Candidatus Sulfopaludibacter sp. SbA3]
MRLYHYLEAKWALDDIRRRRLKLSKIDDMNDPYEAKSVLSHHNGTQSALERTVEELFKRYGALCFSRSWNNILMWSHYGDKHKGICLGFDIAEEITRPVEYEPEPHAVGNLIVEDRSEFSQQEGTNIIDRLFGAKYVGWIYEEEVRVHVGLEEVDEETGQYFLDCGERTKLKEVIAGARFPESKKPIEDALKAYSDVEVFRASASKFHFEIVRERW